MLKVHHLKNLVPTFVVDAPGGGGKISLQPNYIVSQSSKKTVLRNFEGVITSYPEPENYKEDTAEDYFSLVYPDYLNKAAKVGIASIMNDQVQSLIPSDLERMKKREQYQTDPTHSSLKNKREKRDELKEKKFQSQIQKMDGSVKKDE
ncbi:lysine 2,3-aminomutase [Bacillus sp. AFS077874]|uniref:lysine 2,3-aminomutase n=1 Tax=Bacillus sp. AFS077874 TaxID=2033513 RepID=UPI000BFAA85A|nr:lysine 2,3-aminomutase [Bacillus sp. AFS077874]PFM76986.1 lysine 2,3-aminomutase [Bacillus sp. AFS077874]